MSCRPSDDERPASSRPPSGGVSRDKIAGGDATNGCSDKGLRDLTNTEQLRRSLLSADTGLTGEGGRKIETKGGRRTLAAARAAQSEIASSLSWGE